MFLTVGCKVKLQLAGRSGLGVGWGNSDNNPLSYFFVGSLRLHGFNWLSMVRTNIRDRVALYCSASLSNQLFLMNMQPFTYVSAFVSTSDGKHWGHREFSPGLYDGLIIYTVRSPFHLCLVCWIDIMDFTSIKAITLPSESNFCH